ncbi:glycylpeptide N-tetradecanoyltransferase 1-like isoform X3 [Columba livia]|uniref:glycylpeptide N-tetradecanoyltransferase 1-like isoform X3 n=1 Tax=Columba livia TaxID=8932 RepID=UPI0031B9BD68
MADDSETAARRARARPPRPPAEENDHEHCSDCENEAERGSNRGGLSPANDSGAKKKKKKPKRKKEKGGDQPDQAQDQAVKVNSLPAERIQEIQKAIELFSVGQGPAKTMEEASKRSYQFWDTQPVPKLALLEAQWEGNPDAWQVPGPALAGESRSAMGRPQVVPGRLRLDLGNNFFPKGLWGVGTGCPGQCWSHHPWRVGQMDMRFSGHGAVPGFSYGWTP